MTRAEALAMRRAEVLSNGQCVGHLEFDERLGTVLVIDWHAEGCEHVRLIRCEREGCSAEFILVPQRECPTLCLDHAEAVSREVHGWLIANSVD